MDRQSPLALRKQQSLEAIELHKSFTRAATLTQMMVRQKVLTGEEVAGLDGLFKQATMGDGSAWALLRDPAFMFDVNIKAKSGAWSANRGMDRESAKRRYLEVVEELQNKYHVVSPPSRAGSICSMATNYTDLSN